MSPLRSASRPPTFSFSMASWIAKLRSFLPELNCTVRDTDSVLTADMYPMPPKSAMITSSTPKPTPSFILRLNLFMTAYLLASAFDTWAVDLKVLHRCVPESVRRDATSEVNLRGRRCFSIFAEQYVSLTLKTTQCVGVGCPIAGQFRF